MSEAPQRTAIGKGTYQLFLGNLVFTFVAAVTSIIVGRLLGPDGFGLYTIALIVPNYAVLLLNLGLSSTQTRYAARYLSEGNEKKAISFSYTISLFHLGVSALAVAVLIVFTGEISTVILHRPELATGLIIPFALLSALGQILFTDGTAAFVGLNRFGKAAMFQVINGLSKFVLSISLLLAGYSVLGAVLGYTFGFVIAGVLSLSMLMYMNRGIISRNIMEVLRTCIAYAPPIYLSSVLMGVITPYQNTLLAFAVSNTQIGWYSAAVNISTLMALFTYPVSLAVFPLFSRTTPGGTGQLSDAFKLSVKYAALVIVPVTMLVMVLAVPLTVAVYGREFQSGGDYLFFYGIVNLLAGAGSLSDSQFLYGIGETRKALLATAVGSAVAIAASVPLVFYAGVYGIIGAMILGQAVSLYVNLRYISRILATSIQDWLFWRIYLSSAICAAIVYPISLLRISEFVTVPLAAGIFLLVLVPVMTLLRGLERKDLDALRNQFKDLKFVNYLIDILDRYHSLFAK